MISFPSTESINEIVVNDVTEIKPLPMGKTRKSNSMLSEDNNSSDSPCCRICHDNENSSNLIKPCKCSGSLSYVHIGCLQEWRATSGRQAYFAYFLSHSFSATFISYDPSCSFLSIPSSQITVSST